MRGSTTISSSATATDASSPSLAGKTALLGNLGAVDGRSACLGNPRSNKSAERFVSSAVANARGCGIAYEEFPACQNGLGRFPKS